MGKRQKQRLRGRQAEEARKMVAVVPSLAVAESTDTTIANDNVVKKAELPRVAVRRRRMAMSGRSDVFEVLARGGWYMRQAPHLMVDVDDKYVSDARSCAMSC